METTEIKTICHGCRWGGAVVECCRYPHLKFGATIPKTFKNNLALSNAEAIAKSKGIADYNPLSFAAVCIAVIKGTCPHFKPAN